jgi:hypothetical protein
MERIRLMLYKYPYYRGVQEGHMMISCVNGPYSFVLVVIVLQKKVKLFQYRPGEAFRAPGD